MYKEYEEYIDKWIDGIDSEIQFWLGYMKNKGGQFSEGFAFTVEPNKHFTLEEDLPAKTSGIVKFIDVGSGPFSRCGIKTDLVQLQCTAMDPLAGAYNALKKRYNLENGVVVQEGMVELLNYYYESNSFDIVHMSNSMDHCFDAIFALYQLLNICKIGGKVILRHSENEALNENYEGFHQWNLSLHNEEKSFVIWRDNIRYDVCKMLADVADFELTPDCREKGGSGKWIYNKVVMIKKKDVLVPDNNYLWTMFSKLYSHYIINLSNGVYEKNKKRPLLAKVLRKLDRMVEGE